MLCTKNTVVKLFLAWFRWYFFCLVYYIVQCTLPVKSNFTILIVYSQTSFKKTESPQRTVECCRWCIIQCYNFQWKQLPKWQKALCLLTSDTMYMEHGVDDLLWTPWISASKCARFCTRANNNHVHVYPAQVDVSFDQPNTRVGGGEIIHLYSRWNIYTCMSPDWSALT